MTDSKFIFKVIIFKILVENDTQMCHITKVIPLEITNVLTSTARALELDCMAKSQHCHLLAV